MMWPPAEYSLPPPEELEALSRPEPEGKQLTLFPLGARLVALPRARGPRGLVDRLRAKVATASDSDKQEGRQHEHPAGSPPFTLSLPVVGTAGPIMGDAPCR